MKKITFILFISLLTYQANMFAQEISKNGGSNTSSAVFEPTQETIRGINETGFARCLTDETKDC